MNDPREQQIYLSECRISAARQALDNAMKEYVLALKERGVSNELLVSDVCDVLAWATDQDVRINPKVRERPFAQVDGSTSRPRIVCLCGSGRFKAAFDQTEFDETLKGHIVLTIGCNCHDVARSEELKHYKEMLDELHKRKIDLADEVFILNVGSYIGQSTRSELEYAQRLGKPVRYLEPSAKVSDGR